MIKRNHALHFSMNTCRELLPVLGVPFTKSARQCNPPLFIPSTYMFVYVHFPEYLVGLRL